MTKLDTIKKAEIHVHLEATISPLLCKKLARVNKINIPENIYGNKYAYAWDDFYDFIKKYDIITSVIQTPENYSELTYAYLKQCALENVIYVEAMISSAHAKLKGMPYSLFLEGVSAGAKRAEDDFGIISRYIVNGIRHMGPDSVYNTAKEVLENPHTNIVGFGLAGDELNYPPKLFTKTFDMLKLENFPITVHAGEWDGPENIRNAIRMLHPTRLGHGVRSIEDPSLVQEIIDSDILLEVCPTSNIATKIYSNYKEHPVKKLFESGVKLSVNSDDPPFFNATIGGEYSVMSGLGLSFDQLLSLSKNAIQYSFCDIDTKKILIKELSDLS
ncbi:MAG: Adenine deaminase [Alphaproteobacteria bacterium MarineAlpha5_Bin11]|nr:adenosine deaminase [Pelagibacteraceae bacterium]PPR44571.1 MAG: Adenine deaminase [Alphaproteobacteria bacterium MarineAlpha5_Bin11]PPR50867.1 MAG: Adenine deaminase [Alphaproteobacteria bacterium MarineAlpha5_Bin10]|tara:strand:- start:574 stop:1563 length:990 start_codon:yes stop_codon:yes gene_type:complete